MFTSHIYTQRCLEHEDANHSANLHSSASHCPHTVQITTVVTAPQIQSWYVVFSKQNRKWFLGEVSHVCSDQQIVTLNTFKQTYTQINSFTNLHTTETATFKDLICEIEHPVPVSSTRKNVIKLSNTDWNNVMKKLGPL